MRKLIAFILLLWTLTACGTPVPQPASDTLTVVATTDIVGDVVQQVAGDLVEVQVLLPVGADPHSFDPSPQDIAKVANADLVFANGAGLEHFLDKLLASGGATDKMVAVSDGVMLRDEPEADADEDHADEAHGDPHTWTDPNNVSVWVGNIQIALSELDPAHVAEYATNAEAYLAQLQDVDAWIREQVAQIPPAQRRIVTDHLILGYYADAYGFEQVGAIVPGYSSLAEPSAQELAQIEDAIRALNVPVIFVGNTVNPALAERVAEDTGTQLVPLYTGSLSAADGEAATYLDYLRYNTTAIVNGLK